MKRSFLVGLAIVAALVAAYFFILPEKAGQELAHLNAETVALGKDIYEEQCASCHGSNLVGQDDWRSRDQDGYLPAPPHDESGHTWHHPTEQLFEITKFGTSAIVGGTYKSNMGGFEDALSDAEIYAVLAYIKSTWSDRIIARHTQMDADFAAANRP